MKAQPFSSHRTRAILFRAGEAIPRSWWPFRYFQPHELACKCCGNLLHDPEATVRLENLRVLWGRPLIVNSGFRCLTYNAQVGGAIRSMHLEGRAWDLQVDVMERSAFISAAKHAGFTGIGVYETFVHVDDGSLRSWGIVGK